MKRITVKLRDGTERIGYDVGLPGLAIYKSHLYGNRYLWKIAHLPTGTFVPRVGEDTRRRAVAIAEAIYPLVDWANLAYEGAENTDPEIWRQVRGAIRSAKRPPKNRYEELIRSL